MPSRERAFLLVIDLWFRSRRLGLAGLGAGLLVASVSSAADDAKIDLNATTCAELIESNGAARKFYVFWFDGYLAGKHARTVFDADKTQKRLDAVMEACQSDLSQKVLPLMEKQK
jgi:hypothetical protein